MQSWPSGLHHGLLLCIRCRASHVGYIMSPASVSGAELTGLHHGPLLCIMCRANHVAYIMGLSSVSGAGLATWPTSWAPPLYQDQSQLGYIMDHSSMSGAGLATCWATSWAPPLYEVQDKPRELHHGPLLYVRCRATHVGCTRGTWSVLNAGPSSESGAGLAICTKARSFSCMRDGL